MKNAIEIDGLKKSYGPHVVLNGLEFCVRRGRNFCPAGVNGAGKTTALESIEGLRTYDSGKRHSQRQNGHPITVGVLARRISSRWKRSNCLQSGIRPLLTMRR